MPAISALRKPRQQTCAFKAGPTWATKQNLSQKLTNLNKQKHSSYIKENLLKLLNICIKICEKYVNICKQALKIIFIIFYPFQHEPAVSAIQDWNPFPYIQLWYNQTNPIGWEKLSCLRCCCKAWQLPVLCGFVRLTQANNSEALEREGPGHTDEHRNIRNSRKIFLDLLAQRFSACGSRTFVGVKWPFHHWKTDRYHDSKQ